MWGIIMGTFYKIYGPSDELYHHGVKGQKWGVRNYQNEDGSYKPGAEGRYDPDDSVGSAKRAMKAARLERRTANKEYNKAFKQWYDHPLRQFSFRKSTREKDAKAWDEVLRTADNANKSSDKYKQAKKAYKDAKNAKKLARKEYEKTPEGMAEKRAKMADRRRKAAKVGAAAVAAGLAAYGVYKIHDKKVQERRAEAEARSRKIEDAYAAYEFKDLMGKMENMVKEGGWGSGNGSHYSYSVDREGNYRIKRRTSTSNGVLESSGRFKRS